MFKKKIRFVPMKQKTYDNMNAYLTSILVSENLVIIIMFVSKNHYFFVPRNEERQSLFPFKNRSSSSSTQGQIKLLLYGSCMGQLKS